MTTAQTDRLAGLLVNSAIKNPCAVATTAAITLSGEQTIDGVTTSGSRVLVKNQASSIDNGIYVSDSGAWSRAADFNGPRDVVEGTLIKVNGGTTTVGYWYVSTTGSPVPGTDAINFGQSSTVLAVVTAYAQGLLAAATAAAARTVLGLGTAATAAASAFAAAGAATASGLTMATSKLLGRTTASTGAIEEIAVGTGLSLSSGTLSAVLRSYLAGLTMSTAGASATMTIAAGQATDSTNTAMMSLAAAINKTTSAWAVGSGSGGLDTGAIANSTWYHFYQIMRVDTGVVDVVFSTNATSPTMPANYTLFRRIGSGKTNGSAQWIAFTQDGDKYLWTVPVLDVDTTAPGTAAVSATLASVPLGLNVEAIFNFAAWDTGGVGAIQSIVSELTMTDAAPSTTVSPLYNLAASSNGPMAARMYVRTSTAQAIRYRVSGSGAGTTARIATIGWIDRRGRDA